MSRADRLRQAARTERRIATIARAMRPLFAAEFNRMAMYSAAGVRSGGFTRVMDGIKAHTARLNQLLRRVYLVAVPQGAGSFLMDLRKAARPQRDPTDAVTRGALDYVNTYAAQRAEELTETSKGRLQRVLSESIKKGWSSEKTASAIELALGKLAAKLRADVVARTETHAAYNYGSLQAAKGTGAPTKKEWVAVQEDRTRDSHRDADGQTVDIHSPFYVGTAALMFPGDPGAPPEETINCRCTLAYVMDDGSEDDSEDGGD